MKDNKEVISEFNEYVNMTASELEKWLKSDDSNSAGWPKDDGEVDGESVGHDSGRKIVEILQANPDKDPEKYTDDQLQHMRKVASYCKRHLAQEGASNKKKGPEEVKKTKSYASLKNWGYDFLKAQGKAGSEGKGGSKKQKKDEGEEKEEKKEEEQEPKEEEEEKQEEEGQEQKEDEDKGNGGTRRETRQQTAAAAKNDTKKSNGKKQNKKDGDNMDVDEEEEKENGEEVEEKKEDDNNNDGDDNKKTGDKRKKNGQGQQNGANKKRQTSKGKGSKKDDEEEGDDGGQEEQGNKDEKKDDEGGDEEEDGGSKGKSSKNGPKKGDTVSWNWGSGNPKGKVLDVKEDKATIETKNGNKVSRDGDSEDPAVILDTGKSKAIKSAHELN